MGKTSRKKYTPEFKAQVAIEALKEQQRYICITMKTFIDKGHGRNTAGQRSPDGLFLEYYYNRVVARRG